MKARLNENNGIGASNPLELRTIYGPSPVILTIAGNAEDWNRDGDSLDNPVSSDINNLDGCSASPNQNLNSHDDWNNLRYITTPAPGMSLGTNIEMNMSEIPPSSIENTTSNMVNQSEVLEELTVDDVRQHRIELLEGINNAINSLPNTAFSQPQEALELKESLTLTTPPQPTETSDIANLLQTDKLDEAIIQLNELKAKTDSSFGGLEADDLITNPEAQEKVLPLIQNLIQVLEKQK